MGQLRNRVCKVVVGAALGLIQTAISVEKHRVHFVVEKSLKPEPNSCSLEIYNLAPDQRAQIESLKPKTGSTRGIPVQIEAGYQDTGTSQIFLGDLRTVSSRRDGADWITTIESGDGEKAHANARIAVSFGPSTTADTALRAIVKALGVDQGNVPLVLAKLRLGGVGQLFPKRAVLTESAAVHMTNFCKSAGLEWSIQDGAVQIVDRNKALSLFAVLLSSSSGLIESPSIDPDGVLSCKMLIQPDVKPGSLLVLDSKTIHGNYRIESARWDGDTHDTPWYIEVEAKRY